MKWIDVKMRELGVSSNINYKIAFQLDCSAMISVFAEQYGVVEVKPLGVIWGKYPQVACNLEYFYGGLFCEAV